MKYEEVNSALENYGMDCMESMTSFMATICELLRHKAVGNKYFQEGKHAEEMEQLLWHAMENHDILLLFSFAIE